jgi:hypothetical protein
MTVSLFCVNQELTSGGSYTSPSVILDSAPFEDVSATFQYNASTDVTATIELQGRPAPDADWARLLLISGAQVGANTVRYSPEYRLLVTNDLTAQTFSAAIGR